MSTADSDTALVESFVRAIEGRLGTEVAAAVDGISADDISRWRNGRYQRLTDPKRTAIRQYLAQPPAPPRSDMTVDQKAAAFDELVALIEKHRKRAGSVRRTGREVPADGVSPAGKRRKRS